MRKSFEIAISFFQKNHGILRFSVARNLGINPKTLVDMVDAGILVKEARGIYRLAELEPPGNPDLVYVMQKVPSAVICLVSALAFYDMTTQIPYRVYIALSSQERNKPKIKYPPIEVFWYGKKAHGAGIIHIDIDGFKVPIYCIEKTIADCFKFRNKIGKDIAIDALRSYMISRERDIHKLVRYASIDKVDRVIRPYIDALI